MKLIKTNTMIEFAKIFCLIIKNTPVNKIKPAINKSFGLPNSRNIEGRIKIKNPKRIYIVLRINKSSTSF